MNGPISVRGFGPNLLGTCMKRGLQDQTGRGEPPVWFSRSQPLAYIYFLCVTTNKQVLVPQTTKRGERWWDRRGGKEPHSFFQER